MHNLHKKWKLATLLFLRDSKRLKPANEINNIVLSFSSNDKKYAKFFYGLMKYFAPSLPVVEEAASAQEMRHLLDNATKIVTFVSPNYIESHDCIEDFNIALCRHRTEKNPVIFPIQIHSLPKKPSYFHTVYYHVSTADAVWSSLIMQSRVVINVAIQELNDIEYSLSEPDILALLFAARNLIDCFRKEDGDCTPPPRPVLSNIGRLVADTNSLKEVEEVDIKLSKIFLGVK